MKEKLNLVVGMLIVYGLMTLAVMLVLFLTILVSSFVAWNTDLFDIDVFASIFRLSVCLGIISGSIMMYYDWNGMVEASKNI